MAESYLNFESKSSLVSRNITVMGKRTSVRLEPEMWSELKNIARREGCKVNDICSLISLRKGAKTSLTAAIRVFLVLYFRAAATEEGHLKAGHGDFENMKRRAGMSVDVSDLKKQSGKSSQEISSRLSPHLKSTNEKPYLFRAGRSS